MACRLFRKAVQQGRSERRGESYSVPYVEPLSDARTKLADFVNSLLGTDAAIGPGSSRTANRHQRAEVYRLATAPLGVLGLVMMGDVSPDMHFA
jgi:hypothetical protein